MRYDQEKSITVHESFPSIDLAAKYLMKLLPSKLYGMLSNRLIKNVNFLSVFEENLNSKAEFAAGKMKGDQAMFELDNLTSMKKQILKYLSVIPCLIWSQNPCETDNLMHCLLIQLCEKIDPAFVAISFLKGKLSTIGAKKCFPGNFRNLNCLTTATFSNDAYSTFETVLCKFWKDFSLDLLECNTPNLIGQVLMTSEIHARDLMSMKSPHMELNEALKQVVRYGLLECIPGIVHENSPLKSGISLDYKKFYLSVIGNIPLLLGECLKFEQNEKNGKYVCEPTRKRGTFANIFFAAIDDATEDNLYFAIHGKEPRNIFPVDAISSDCNGNKTIYQYLGCFWHLSCGPNGSLKECHLPVKSTEHLRSCVICQNSKKRTPCDVMKPRLWQLKPNENMQSLHPVKKMTYEEVSRQSFINEQKVIEGGNYQKFCRICECTIIGCYYSKLKVLTDLMGLVIKPQFSDLRLCDYLINTAEKHFPLLKKSGILSFQELRRGLTFGQISGFSIVDAQIGKVGQENLGILRPFSYRNSQGRNEATFEIQKRIVENSYLEFLLNCKYLPDFEVTAIYKVYEFKKPCQYVMKSFENKVKHVLLQEEQGDMDGDNQEASKVYQALLKSSVNSCIGSFAMNLNKYSKSYVTTRKNFESITQLRNLVTSTPLTENLAIIHFRNRSSVLNLNHLNFQTICVGRRKMIEFALEIKNFTSLNVTQVNVDGLTLTSNQKWPLEILSMGELGHQAESSLSLDAMMKSHLSPGQKREFVEFKKNYFSKLGFCSDHELQYINCLINGLTFEPLSCCHKAINETPIFEMKIELIFDKALFMAANRYKISNRISKKNVTKCSGHWDSKFDIDFDALTVNELIQLTK